MAFSFLKSALQPKLDLDVIEMISARTADFWSKAHGWAPKEAADLLSNSRLDWLDSFNRTLRARVQDVTEHPDEPAVLILAWAHLRTLVEGHLKLFLAVFLMDYLKDPHAPLKDHKKPEKGPKIPDTMSYEAIRQFIGKKELLASHHGLIDMVQQRGNAIHAFADRPIGTAEEYLEHIALYRKFLESVEYSLPNPYTN
jgi:hypothetical protein